MPRTGRPLPIQRGERSRLGCSSDLPYVFSARTALPLPVRNERGEGKSTADTPALLPAEKPPRPPPSPPAAGGEGEKSGALNTYRRPRRPISGCRGGLGEGAKPSARGGRAPRAHYRYPVHAPPAPPGRARSEEHTSELQPRPPHRC